MLIPQRACDFANMPEFRVDPGPLPSHTANMMVCCLCPGYVPIKGHAHRSRSPHYYNKLNSASQSSPARGVSGLQVTVAQQMRWCARPLCRTGPISAGLRILSAGLKPRSTSSSGWSRLGRSTTVTRSVRSVAFHRSSWCTRSSKIGPVASVRSDWANLRSCPGVCRAVRSRGPPRRWSTSRIGTVSAHVIRLGRSQVPFSERGGVKDTQGDTGNAAEQARSAALLCGENTPATLRTGFPSPFAPSPRNSRAGCRVERGVSDR